MLRPLRFTPASLGVVTAARLVSGGLVVARSADTQKAAEKAERKLSGFRQDWGSGGRLVARLQVAGTRSGAPLVELADPGLLRI